MRKIFILYLLFFTLSLHAELVKVAAAANLTFVIKELRADFQKKHPNDTIQITFAGSGKLASQILHSAPYDIFLSANTTYPTKLYAAKKGLREPEVYTKGALALLSVNKHDFSKGLNILRQSTIKRIAVANPKTAPYGKASIEALQNAHLYKLIKKKLIYGESIAQTLNYTLHASDFGFIAKSALYAPQLRRFQKGVNWIDVDPTLYKPIKQSALLLTHAKTNNAAKEFYSYLFSKQAKTIFQKYGYQ